MLRVRFAWGHKKDVKRIAEALLHTDVVVSHSNGANYRAQAMELAHKMDPEKSWIVFDISAALDNDHDYPPYCTHVFVYATPHDKAVRAARWFRFNHPWGDMGRVGYKGSRDDVVTWLNPESDEHSDWFSGDDTQQTGGRIMSDLAGIGYA